MQGPRAQSGAFVYHGKGAEALKHPELTELEITTILRLGKQGVFYSEIARLMRRGKSTISKVLTQHGMHRSPGPPKKSAKEACAARLIKRPVAKSDWMAEITPAQLMARR